MIEIFFSGIISMRTGHITGVIKQLPVSDKKDPGIFKVKTPVNVCFASAVSI